MCPIDSLPNDLIRSPAKRSELVAKKQHQIVEGACRLFEEKGFHPTTIREIAAACKMSMGQLYHYISSKDDILFLVHREMEYEWYEQILASGIEKISDPVQRLRKSIVHTVSISLKWKKMVLMMNTEAKNLSKEHLKVVLDLHSRNMVQFYRKLIEDLRQTKPIPVDIEIAANFVAYSASFYVLRGWNIRSKTAKQKADFMADFLLGGLGFLPENR
jgi:AcrR family transcriptional regulator